MVVDKSGYESGSKDSPFTSDINLSDSAKKKKKKTKKKPCEVCGSVADELSIMICVKCRDTREHTYCARMLLHRVPRIWLCEECRDPSSANHQVKEAAQLSRTVQVEQVVVNKVSIDQTVPLSRTKQLIVDNQVPIDRQTAPSSLRTNQVVDKKDWMGAAPSSRTNQVVEQVVPVIHQHTTEESIPRSQVMKPIFSFSPSL
ncbi:PREDICTED: uncharacterized protein LOC104762221 [Camelina sativa]|uniref:Uncharacterized protein LOC104762221 n=1 Tax=Camelina sativa TaxID=90675 RepID=A0ABM0XC67_CAMSA|nr:PREDICTED: uncharacterized protein LOC104762221 [Camelina sativa]